MARAERALAMLKAKEVQKCWPSLGEQGQIGLLAGAGAV